MGIKVIHVDREDFKTIFKLQVYEIVGLSKPKYRLDEAEKHIKRIAAQDYRDLYGFVVSERPLGHLISGMRDISTRN